MGPFRTPSAGDLLFFAILIVGLPGAIIGGGIVWLLMR